MLWNALVWLFWIGEGLSFLVMVFLSMFALVADEQPIAERVGMFIWLWVRWFFGVVGGVIMMIVLALVLNWFGVAVHGIMGVGDERPPARNTRSGPLGRNCPTSHPIKANLSSRIYHLPGDRYYDATEPEDCFSSVGAAEAAGYRRAKR